MELKARLSQARNRLLLKIFMRHLAVSLAGSFTAAALMLLLAPISGITVPALSLLLSAAAAALVASLISTAYTDTSHLRAARLLEQADPSLHAQLSTALELSEQGLNTSPLRQAQLKGATELAVQLNVAERIPLRLPRWIAAFLIGGTSLMGVTALFDSPVRPPSAIQPQAVSQPAAGFSEDEQASLVSSLQQLSELFTPEAENLDDPYLEAIGRQLQDLGTRLDNDQLTREQLSQEIERLLQHTHTALELRNEQALGVPETDLTELLEAALREVRRPEEQLVAETPGESSAQASEPETGGEQDGTRDPDAPAAEQAAPSLEDLLAAADAQEPATGPGQGTAEQAQRTGSYFDYAIDERTMAELNARAMEQAMSEAAGEAIGASSQSEEGASSLAGGGTDELFGSEAAERLNAERLEQLNVSEETDPEGRRVRVEVNPEAEFTEVFATPLGDTSWSRNSESEVLREVLMTDQRSVTARYHTPEQSQ